MVALITFNSKWVQQQRMSHFANKRLETNKRRLDKLTHSRRLIFEKLISKGTKLKIKPSQFQSMRMQN